MIGGNLNPIIQISKNRKNILNKLSIDPSHAIFESISNTQNIKSRKIKQIHYPDLPVSCIVNEDTILIKANTKEIKLVNLLGLNTENSTHIYLIKDRSNNIKSAFTLNAQDKYISEISFVDVDSKNSNFQESIDRLFSLNITSDYFCNESTRISHIPVDSKYLTD